MYTKQEHVAKRAPLEKRCQDAKTGVWADPDTHATWSNSRAMEERDDRARRSRSDASESRPHRGNADSGREGFATPRKTSEASGVMSDSATSSAFAEWTEHRTVGHNRRSDTREPPDGRKKAGLYKFDLEDGSVIHVMHELFHLGNGSCVTKSIWLR